MMRSIVLALALASTAAFAPSSSRTATRSVAMEAGAKSRAIPFLPAQPLLDGSMIGDMGFDPLGLSNINPKSLPQVVPPAAVMAGEPLPTLYWMREAELKHGRLAQMALVGFASVDMGAHFLAVPSGISSVAAHDIAVANGSMGFLLFLASLLELLTTPALFQASKGSGREPGDFALDPLNFCNTPEKTADLKLKEITHCRLAMLAFSGMVTQSVAVSPEFPYLGL